MNLYIGIDFGTSGARAVVIDAAAKIQAEARYTFEASAHCPSDWQTALFALIAQIPKVLRSKVEAIAINGTSSTVLLCDAAGRPVDAPLLYNDARGMAVMETLRGIAPPNHTVLSATSSLAKLLWMTQLPSFTKARYFLHQADWLAFLLHGCPGISDYHNALKLGYDVEQLSYPAWITDLPVMQLLPKVFAPGTPVAEVTAEIAELFSLRRDCLICAGTTDSIAAFLASGAESPGEAVTSLGSTLVLKLLSSRRVEDARYGIYSHRLSWKVCSTGGLGVPSGELKAPTEWGLGAGGETPARNFPLGNLWLTGGASNTGGAVLRQFFTDAQLEHFSRQIDSSPESQLDYYPLLQPGERFPINDPHLLPRLEPRPADPVEFLHGLLESIARIELRGYQLLQHLGANSLTHVYTAGGGATNSSWAEIRARLLGVPLVAPVHTAAAYGTALLALRGVADERQAGCG